MLYSPIKPPIRKQTICAIIRSITSTESFLPLRFSIMVPCILLVLSRTSLVIVTPRSRPRDLRHPQRRQRRRDTAPSEMMRNAGDSEQAFANRGIGPSKWKPPDTSVRELAVELAAFAKFRISRRIELSRLPGVAGDVSIPR